MIATKHLAKYSKSILSSVNLLKWRNLYSSSTLRTRIFEEHENSYAYRVMENKGYAINLFKERKSTLLSEVDYEKLLKDFSKKPPKDIFEDFSLLADYCSEHNICISNKIFDDFVDRLTDNIKHASDEELQSIFYSLVKWPETESVRTRNFIEVWAALDDECLNRFNLWSYDNKLMFVSLFYMLRVTKLSDFSRKSIQRLASKAKHLTTAQFVQTMFFVGVLRIQPFDVHNLELQLDSLFQGLTVDDLAITSLGFFKSKTPIRSMELVIKIINRVIENSKDIHEVSLTALLKVIRYSMKIPVENKIYDLLDILQHEVPRLSIMCNIHIALLGTATLTLHKDCLDKVAATVLNCMSDTRLKDLERLVLTYATFNLVPSTKECFFENVMNELRKPERQPEINRYGRSFAGCVAYLGLLGIYPTDLMANALCSDFLEKTYGKHCYNYGREILAINNMSQIFCSEVKMTHLSDKIVTILAKKYTDYVPNENYKKQFNVTEKMFLDVFKIMVESCGGNDYVVADHILTHHQRGDIIICNNREGVPQPIGDKFNNENFGPIRRQPDHNYWVVLVIVGRNAIIHNSDMPTGPSQAKIRELTALGFHPVLVRWTIYNNMKTYAEKNNYLNNLIKEAMKINT